MDFTKRSLIGLLALALAWGGELCAQPAGAALPEGQYKRIHQQVLREILAGHLDEAVQSLQDTLTDYPDDAESHFMLTIAHARQGRLDQAAASMERALSMGLPPGRFIPFPHACFYRFTADHLLGG